MTKLPTFSLEDLSGPWMPGAYYRMLPKENENGTNLKQRKQKLEISEFAKTRAEKS